MSINSIENLSDELFYEILDYLNGLIGTWSVQKDSGDTYRLIFNLPELKYIKYTATKPSDVDITIPSPMATNEQITSIEYLIMDRLCAIDELFAIISFTSHLRHLKFLNLTNRNVNI
ncbi:unnamed protein product [Rotaria sp. Silwood1]|nr:unnamed protein product [Rotaria sp. Silwood1]CAF3868838.1 unnamed protein product [Rotaria sp. Silwood1]CAF4804181.1 unnamed protein product [Rotaria sp. Silwood1]